MSDLETLGAEIQRVAKTAATNLEDIPWQTRSAWGISIEEAKARLGSLKKAYREAILKNGVAIFLEGNAEKAAEFAKLIRESGEGLVVDASALYERLAKGVNGTMGDTRQWGVHQSAKLNRDLQEVMHEIGLKDMPAPTRKDMPVLPKYEDVVAHVRGLIRDTCDDTLNALYIAEQALKGAIEIRYTGSVAPVAILNATDEERYGVAKSFAKGSATVTMKADDEIDKNYLVKTFKDVNKRIRKK